MAAKNEVQQIVDALSEVYDQRGVVIWLRSRHFTDRALGGKVSALDMIEDGNGAEVLQRARSLSGMVAT